VSIAWDDRGTTAIGRVDGKDRYLVCNLRSTDSDEWFSILATRLPMARGELATFFGSMSRAKSFCEMDDAGELPTNLAAWLG
jgi:hypothetical protein